MQSPVMLTMSWRSPARRDSLVAFLLVFSGLFIAWFLARYLEDDLIGGAVGGLSIVVGFWIALRLRCPRCETRLSKYFPYWGGGGILLWMVRSKCPNCAELPW